MLTMTNWTKLINTESDKEQLYSSQQIYSVTVSEKPTGSDFPVEIQGYKTNSLLDTGAQVSCICHGCYLKLSIKPKIHTKV